MDVSSSSSAEAFLLFRFLGGSRFSNSSLCSGSDWLTSLLKQVNPVVVSTLSAALAGILTTTMLSQALLSSFSPLVFDVFSSS